SDTFNDPYDLDQTGTWSLLIDPNGTDTGSVTIALTSAPDVTGTITVGTAKTITTTKPGQVAKYTFSGTNNHNITIKLTNSTYSSAAIYLLRPDGSFLSGTGFSSGDTFIDPATLDVPGTNTWTVLLDASGEETGSVKVLLSDVPDLTGTITLGTSVTIPSPTT